MYVADSKSHSGFDCQVTVPPVPLTSGPFNLQSTISTIINLQCHRSMLADRNARLLTPRKLGQEFESGTWKGPQCKFLCLIYSTKYISRIIWSVKLFYKGVPASHPGPPIAVLLGHSTRPRSDQVLLMPPASQIVPARGLDLDRTLRKRSR